MAREGHGTDCALPNPAAARARLVPAKCRSTRWELNSSPLWQRTEPSCSGADFSEPEPRLSAPQRGPAATSARGRGDSPVLCPPWSDPGGIGVIRAGTGLVEKQNLEPAEVLSWSHRAEPRLRSPEQRPDGGAGWEEELDSLSAADPGNVSCGSPRAPVGVTCAVTSPGWAGGRDSRDLPLPGRSAPCTGRVAATAPEARLSLRGHRHSGALGTRLCCRSLSVTPSPSPRSATPTSAGCRPARLPPSPSPSPLPPSLLPARAFFNSPLPAQLPRA